MSFWTQRQQDLYDAAHKLSVLRCASRDADTHKYWMSQRLGYDVGGFGIDDWAHRYFKEYVRWRWREHVEGSHFYEEFGMANFAATHHPSLDPQLCNELVDKIVKQAYENLDLLFTYGCGIEATLHLLHINVKQMPFLYHHP